MPNAVLLNNVAHKDLKVINRYGAEFGDNLSSVLTFPTEFADMQREYPILLRKNDKTGEFQTHAVLGFEPGENLYLNNDNWDASYVPAIVARGPFLIGFQEKEMDGELQRETVIHVDMDNPRVSQSEGEPVFLEHGGNSPYLEKVVKTLNAIHEGLGYGKVMYEALADLELIEPVNLEIQITPEAQYNLTGYYAINEDKLRDLDAANLEKLNKMGFLEGVYLLKSSLSNIKSLVERKRAAL
ncbi:SapC family protein [Gilvimarinus agarilyticus]|uniref:SapC family protein n=1 Tax=Gilvimarinus sp. 2_MG-2023 TaxID=3062666 RepID=UPI001C09E387|nr:SapC family protein [Gilvimarinus sp. 2_MG-2023]MBU2887414.1 SapC family protein [Gilvimarinus agarilyticus]MDO6572073.1 SapC family protein [Gilvimarinus sp. 2_MG-2023]